jgi:hypothetical protein
MKNEQVDAGVIPQVLEYAIWAEGNPDSIRGLWLEAKNRPEEYNVNWDDYSVRVIIIAPSIDRTVVEHVDKIAYEVELIEVARWVSGAETWLLVNRLEPITGKRARPTSGLGRYPEDYKDLYNPASVAGFVKLANGLQRVARKNGWPVERKFNQGYCGFKVGNFVVFGVKWLGSRSYGLFFKVPKPFATGYRVRKYPLLRYEGLWKEAVFRVDADDVRLPAFLPFFRKALAQRVK